MYPHNCLFLGHNVDFYFKIMLTGIRWRQTGVSVDKVRFSLLDLFQHANN